jgi:hypothetical protein
VREWGIEQIVRDARIAMIYEGTNEIQAIDLLIRKTLPDGGAQLNLLLDDLAQDLQADHPADQRLLARLAQLRELLPALVAASTADAARPYWIASDFLRLLAQLGLQWAWSRIDAACGASSGSATGRWRAPALAVQHWIAPEFDMRLAIIRAALLQPAAA